MRNEQLDWLVHEAIPQLTKSLAKPKVALLAFTAVLIFLVLPIAMAKFSSVFFAWLFVRRPTIVGAQDSDIYKNWLKRLFFKYPPPTPVIANPELDKRLKSLVKTNQIITKKNKGTWYSDPKKTPYPHVLAYGAAGVGKTLFAKNLARKSGMHFLYLTVADLSQLGEEEAIETLKNFFSYAKKYGPCVLIIDEADRLFAKGDIKAQKLAQLFQREFAKAVNEHVQLFFITNHPNRFPSPILNRVAEVIHFDAPTFKTQLSLFAMHLNRAFNLQKKHIDIEALLGDLTPKLLEGLVGRDIEAIAISYSLVERHMTLAEKIIAFKKSRKKMKKFKLAKESAGYF